MTKRPWDPSYEPKLRKPGSTKRTRPLVILVSDSESSTDSDIEDVSPITTTKSIPHQFFLSRSSSEESEPDVMIISSSSSSSSEDEEIESVAETVVETDEELGGLSQVELRWVPLPILAAKNPHPKDQHIRFQDEGHKYWIKGCDKGVISTTTILKTYFEDFNPHFIIRRIMRPTNRPYWEDPEYKYYQKDAAEIREMWSEIGRKAAEAGTYNHEQIEGYYNGLPVDFSKREHSELFSAFYLDHVTMYEPYRTEMLVFHERLRITGAIDMMFRNRMTGKIVLADWKFIKRLAKRNRSKQGQPPLDHLDDTNFTKYSLQLSVYRYLLETEYGYEIEDQFLVILHGNQKKYRKEVTPYLKKEVEAVFAIREAEVIEQDTKEAMDAMLEQIHEAEVIEQGTKEVIDAILHQISVK